MRALLKFVAVLVLVAAAWLAWALWLPLRPAGQKTVLLHPGFTTRHIARALKSAGVIRSSTAFLLWHFVAHPSTLKAGEYLFEQPASAVQVHRRLARGDVYVHSVVVPEGFNMFEVAQALSDAGLGSRQEFLQAARADTVLIKDLDPQATSLEGYLFPDTYQFTRTQTPTDMLAVMVHRFRAKAKALGLTGDLHQVVTMASIVEKETAAPEERPLVASVYFNRLNQHVALDADPSVIYAKLLAGSYSGALHHDDMQFNSPYNTYRHVGLPPGPIANPGVASLQAAMHPASTDYLYFVSAGDGHHRFAATLEEHNHNVALYRKAVNVMR
ncbi:MAG TPA: endolytic transglycosylase MltG [Terriglobales bacterium]|nr:endolytic transglycosylase MltG [Terriglobales bacterium]